MGAVALVLVIFLVQGYSPAVAKAAQAAVAVALRLTQYQAAMVA